MRKLFITILTAAAMLVLPSMANAAGCNVGVTNGVSVAPPQAVWTGQTQTQNYMVTACTETQKVTVEWVKVINSDLPFMLNAGNRTTISGETSVGTNMIGSSTWTVPATATPGHYGVITRYYAKNQTAPEATAASSFVIAVDVCPNMAGGQTTTPANHTPAPDCRPDVCPTLAGVQADAPAGTTAPTCENPPPPPVVLPPVVVPPVTPPTCPNIPTMTLTAAVAAGLTIDAAGNCVETATPQGKTGAPKLGITKVGSTKVVKQGGLVKFTIKVRNTGDADSGRTRVCDIFPAGMTFISNTNGGTFSLGKLCWTIPNVAKGKTVTVGTVTVKITKPSGRVVNTACIMANPVTGNARKLCAKAPVTVTSRKPEPSGGVTG